MYVECEWCGKIFYRRKNDKRYTGIYCSQDCITARDVNNYKIKFLKENKTFRIVKYTDKENVEIECRKCHKKITRDSTAAIRRKACPYCQQEKIKRAKEQEQREREKRKRIQEIEQLEKRVAKLSERIEKAWGAIERREKAKETAKEKKKAENKRHELVREKRIKNNGRIDKDITLPKLFDRDQGICYLCGKPCDYEDYHITEEGYFIAGKSYPSIDHVKPLSKGGTHTWENIRLAHLSCNSRKRERVPGTLQDFKI